MQNREIRADLRVIRLEPWSLMRSGFLISLSIAVTLFTASILVYLILAGMGVFSSIDALLGDIFGSPGTFTDTFTLPVVILGALVLSAFEVVTTTAFIVLTGFVYNLVVPFTGGLEVTLAEDVLGDRDPDSDPLKAPIREEMPRERRLSGVKVTWPKRLR